MPDDSTGLRSVSATPLELLRTPPPRERADAARNRVAVLRAAARLFAEHGVAGVSMDQVAAVSTDARLRAASARSLGGGARSNSRGVAEADRSPVLSWDISGL